MQRYKLGEICKIVSGISFKKSDYIESGIPVLKIENIKNNKVDENNISYVDPNKLSNNKEALVRPGDVVITSRGSIKIGINLTSEDFVCSNNVFKLTPNPELDRKYLFHFLLSEVEEIEKVLSCVTRPQLNKSALEQLTIPLPALEEQKRIATILDQFMELKRELMMRKQQYEYYRDFLIKRPWIE